MKKESKAKASSMTESKTYQTMLGELDEIVRSVGQDELDLDDIVEKIERGYQLIATMRHRLDTTRAKVEKLRVDFERGKEDGHAQKITGSAPGDKGSQAKADDGNDDDDLPF